VLESASCRYNTKKAAMYRHKQVSVVFSANAPYLALSSSQAAQSTRQSTRSKRTISDFPIDITHAYISLVISFYSDCHDNSYLEDAATLLSVCPDLQSRLDRRQRFKHPPSALFGYLFGTPPSCDNRMISSVVRATIPPCPWSCGKSAKGRAAVKAVADEGLGIPLAAIGYGRPRRNYVK